METLLRTHRGTLQQALLDLDEACADDGSNPDDVINACTTLKNACQERRTEAQAAAATAQRALATSQAACSNALAALDKVCLFCVALLVRPLWWYVCGCLLTVPGSRCEP